MSRAIGWRAIRAINALRKAVDRSTSLYWICGVRRQVRPHAVLWTWSHFGECFPEVVQHGFGIHCLLSDPRAPPSASMPTIRCFTLGSGFVKSIFIRCWESTQAASTLGCSRPRLPPTVRPYRTARRGRDFAAFDPQMLGSTQGATLTPRGTTTGLAQQFALPPTACTDLFEKRWRIFCV